MKHARWDLAWLSCTQSPGKGQRPCAAVRPEIAPRALLRTSGAAPALPALACSSKPTLHDSRIDGAPGGRCGARAAGAARRRARSRPRARRPRLRSAAARRSLWRRPRRCTRRRRRRRPLASRSRGRRRRRWRWPCARPAARRSTRSSRPSRRRWRRVSASALLVAL